jgi:hypothetical protein
LQKRERYAILKLRRGGWWIVKHKWQESEHVSMSGGKLWACRMCGLYTSVKPLRGSSKVGECKPGKYAGMFEVVDGVVGLKFPEGKLR